MKYKYLIIKKTFLNVLILILGLIPAVRLISVVYTTGMNNLSNDYLSFSPIVIDAMNNGFPFYNLGSTCFNGQCQPITFMLMTFFAKYFYWNVYIVLFFSIFITLVTILIIYFLYAGFSFHPKSSWIFVYISALCLSVTQISTYTYGHTSLCSTICLMGFCLGLLGVKYFPNSYKGMVFIIIGMWFAVWSYGAGLVTIPIFFLGVLIGFKHKKYYILWVISLLVISIPYIQYYLIDQVGLQSGVSFISFFNFHWIITAAGYFLSNGSYLFYPSYEFIPTNPLIIGYVGIALLVLAIVIQFIKLKFQIFRRYFVELALVTFGLGCLWQISIVRFDITPWYIVSAAPFWLGLVGLYYPLLKEDKGSSIKLIIGRIFSGLFFAIILVLFINSNITYEDKIFHIRSRAPVSSTCLRKYKTAPTYCEGMLFQWGVGNGNLIQQLAEPLEDNNLSVFAPHQIWSLQGEYAFDSVRITKSPNSSKESWWTGLDGELSRWDSYKHLDIMLPSESMLSWTIELPQNIMSAELITAIGINRNFNDINADNVRFKISIELPDQPVKTVFEKQIPPDTHKWSPIRIPLNEYGGESITIHMSTSGGEGNAGEWAMYQFPIIDLHESKTVQPLSKNDGVNPENTDLSNTMATVSTDDYIIDDKSDYLVGTNIFQIVDDPVCWRLGKNSSLTLIKPIDVCLSGYTDFVVSLSLTTDVSPRFIDIIFTIDGQRFELVRMPLLLDEEIHSYSYPLRLLDIDPSSRLTNINIYLPESKSNNSEVRFMGMRLTRSSSPRVYYLPQYRIIPETPIGEIIKGDELSQTFISECNGTIDQFNIFIGTYIRKNSYTMKLVLLDTVTGNILGVSEIPLESVINDSWNTIKISPVDNSYQKKLTFILTAPNSTYGNAIAVYQSLLLDKFPLVFNGVPGNGSVVFEYRCIIEESFESD